MPGSGKYKTCRDKQAAKETSEDADTLRGMGEKGLNGTGTVGPCIRSQKERVWLNTQEKSGSNERPDPPPYEQAAYYCTRGVHGAGEYVGKALQSPDLLKDTSWAHSCLRLALDRAYYSKEGSQQEEMEPISSSLILFSALCHRDHR